MHRLPGSICIMTDIHSFIIQHINSVCSTVIAFHALQSALDTQLSTLSNILQIPQLPVFPV